MLVAFRIACLDELGAGFAPTYDSLSPPSFQLSESEVAGRGIIPDRLRHEAGSESLAVLCRPLGYSKILLVPSCCCCCGGAMVAGGESWDAAATADEVASAASASVTASVGSEEVHRDRRK